MPDCSDALPGWTCTGGDLTQPDTCETTCGDGFLVGTEVCDAGTDPGCKPDCSDVLNGYQCDHYPGSKSDC